MPIPVLGHDQPAAICCDSWWSIAETLVTIAGNAVNDCFGENCPDIPFFVSHDEPIGHSSEYLGAWISSVGQGLSVSAGRMLFVPSLRADIEMALRLTAPDMSIKSIGGELTVQPTSQEYTNTSYFSYGAAQAMYKAVLNALVSTPNSVLGACSKASAGNLTPEKPAASMVGWRMRVTVEMP